MNLIDANVFTIIKDTKTMVAETSDLIGLVTCSEFPLRIRGKRSVVEFEYLGGEEDFREQEILAHVFAPTMEEIRKNPDLYGWTIRIFND